MTNLKVKLIGISCFYAKPYTYFIGELGGYKFTFSKRFNEYGNFVTWCTNNGLEKEIVIEWRKAGCKIKGTEFDEYVNNNTKLRLSND